MTHKRSGYFCVEKICTFLLFVVLGLFFMSPGLEVPIAAGESQCEGGFILPEYYPDKFDGTGRISRITMDEIVVNDSLYRLSPYAEYATPTSEHALRAWFQVGNCVGYITDAKDVIISLWLIE